MSILPRRTITSKYPVTADEVRTFADAAKIGDTLSAKLAFRTFVSTASINFIEKPVKVTILNKYPYLVETNKGTFLWSELLLGYYSYSGPDSISTDESGSSANLRKNIKGSKLAA